MNVNKVIADEAMNVNKVIADECEQGRSLLPL
jgi:hypothetical protein